MANHRAAAAAALLLMATLLVAVTLSGANASPTVLPNKVSSAVLGGANHDRHPHGLGLADAAAGKMVDQGCDHDEEDNYSSHKHHHKHHPKHHGKDDENKYPDHKRHGDDDDGKYLDHPMHPEPEHTEESPYPAGDSVEQELCSDCEEPKAPPPLPCNSCEEPKTTPPPPCNTCEEPKEPELKCNKVHAVRDGDTCYSVGQCAGLGQDDFLRFNPNICCDHLFVGQWVCLDATCAA